MSDEIADCILCGQHVGNITDAIPDIIVVSDDFDPSLHDGAEFYGKKWITVGDGIDGPVCFSTCLSKLSDKLVKPEGELNGWYKLSDFLAAGFPNPFDTPAITQPYS